VIKDAGKESIFFNCTRAKNIGLLTRNSLSSKDLAHFQKKNTSAFPLSMLRPIPDLGAGFGVKFSSGDRRDAAAFIMLNFFSTAIA
jgi:hypothetical protein